mgnify:CR=1 FL=1
MYDLVFLAIFTIFIVWFLYTRRKNLDREGILFLYRTKFGIRAIDWNNPIIRASNGLIWSCDLFPFDKISAKIITKLKRIKAKATIHV